VQAGLPVAPIAEVLFAGNSVRVFSGADVDTLRALLHVLMEYPQC